MTQRMLFEGRVVVTGSTITELPCPTHAATLYQPWAWLVATGMKPLENRPKGFWRRNFRGWFWIHAGARISVHEAERAAALARTNGVTSLPPEVMLPHGAIIGMARVTGCLDVPDPGSLPDGWRMEGKLGFVLAEARPLKTPVPARGYQCFWRVPEDVRALLKAAEFE